MEWFKIKGRASRSEFWAKTGIILGCEFLMSCVPEEIYTLFYILYFIVDVDWYMTFCRRLQDINAKVNLLGFLDGDDNPTFWDYFIGISALGDIIYLVAVLFGFYIDPSNVSGRAGVFLTVAEWAPLALLLVSFVVGCIDGTVGANKYGPDPKNRTK